MNMNQLYVAIYPELRKKMWEVPTEEHHAYFKNTLRLDIFTEYNLLLYKLNCCLQTRLIQKYYFIYSTNHPAYKNRLIHFTYSHVNGSEGTICIAKLADLNSVTTNDIDTAVFQLTVGKYLHENKQLIKAYNSGIILEHDIDTITNI